MPKFKKASADEFFSKRKDHVRGDASDAVMVKGFKSPKSWNPDERSATFIMSSESVDRYGDIVVQAGLETERFLQNPQGLLFHNSRSWPCGTWSNITKVLSGRPKRTEGKLTFLPEGADEDADRAARHVAAGTLRTVSIGFRPDWEEIEFILDDDGDWTGGFRFGKSELLECSVVPIPAQPDAVVKSAGGDLRLARDLIEDILDTYAKTPEGLLLPIKDFEQAYRMTVEKIADDRIDPASVTVVGDTEHDEERSPSTEDDVVERSEADENVDVASDEGLGDFLAKIQKGDTVRSYFQLAGQATIEKGFTIERAGTDKIESIEFKDGITNEHRTALLKRMDELLAEAPPESENKSGTDGVALKVSVDTSEAEAAVERMSGIFAKLAEKFPMFFPKKDVERIEPTIEPPEPAAPPSEEAVEAARAKAAAVRERLVSKGLAQAA